MPKISLWHSNKGLDYQYADRIAGENLQLGGVGILLHKYIGVEGEEPDVTDVQDFLFLENRDRKYDDQVFELRGHFIPEDVDYDLTQFGIFLSSDMLRFTFHYNDMIRMLGRKIMAGDVVELPNQRDITLDGVAINDYYVVQDALFAAAGHSHTWYPHLWKVRGKQMPAAPEYKDILDKASTGETAGGEGDGTGLMPAGFGDSVTADGEPGFGTVPAIANAINRYCVILGITDEVVKEAEENVCFDPKFFATQHLWVTMDEETGYPLIEYWRGGDGVPPNGAPLKGIGTQFPEDMLDGEYFLRVDYEPDRLFQKQGDCYVRIEDDLRRIWTATNTKLDTYIDNINTITLDDGTTIREKQPLSKVIPDREGLNDETKEQVKEDEENRSRIAKKLDGAG